MSLSGLRNMKREWSSSTNDLTDNGVGVIATKVNGSYNNSSSSSKGQPCSELPSNASSKPVHYDYDQEFDDDIDWSFSTTPRNDVSSPAFSASNVVRASKGSDPPIAAASGFIKASQVARDQSQIEHKISSGNVEKNAGQGYVNKAEEEPKRKRQFPSSFTNPNAPQDKFKYAKTAAELQSSGERLRFLINGDGDQKETSTSTVAVHKVKDVGRIFLSKEQQVVYHRVVTEGKSVFFTGSAGTGKSVLLREIIKGLHRKFQPKLDAIAVTASTGIAACNIGGTTLHAFSGAGLCADSVDKLLVKVRKVKKSVSRWMRTSVLIIDEISMIAPELLDTLEEMARRLRRNDKPFGGLQVVMTGDFFQLPPVTKGSQRTKYAFDAKCWPKIAQEQINLTQVFRQKDPEFVNMLNELRFGKLSQKTVDLFTSLSKESEMQRNSSLSPTILFPMRHEVDKANAMELLKIKRKSYTFDARDDGTTHAEHRQRILENFMAPAKLHLKMGCQVMLIKNTDETLVNGSLGTVLCFLTSHEWYEAAYCGMDWEAVDPLKMTEDEVREQIHDRYKTTRQSEQNMSEAEKHELHLLTSGDASTGMIGGDAKVGGATKTRMDLAEALQREERRERSRSRSVSPERREPTRLPVVRFMVVGGGSRRTRTVLVQRETWKNELSNGEVLASRMQIPLILAWAMSIHKSQGQTLPLVKIDLSKTFEKGQAYVALSRAVSKEGLQVLGFDGSKVRVDARVVDWYKNLLTVF